MTPMLDLPVDDPSRVAEARRRAVECAVAAGFDTTQRGEVALAATELATNLLKHAGGGRLLAGRWDRRVELLALDRGPGMADVDACLADGYSTAGTRGQGLGAVRRLAQQFAVAAWPGRGCAVYAAFDPPGVPCPRPEALGAVLVAKPGETACGDAWHWHDDDRGQRSLLAVDGLGHGTEAAVAAHAAVTAFERHRGVAPAEALAVLHQAMRPSRGGAVAVARIEPDAGVVAFAGLGNIAGSVHLGGGVVRRMVSHNGTAGHNARKLQAFDYPYGEGLLIMHSDGIGTHWNLDPYPGVWRLPPTLVAGLVYRDHGRGRDDALVVVARLERP